MLTRCPHCSTWFRVRAEQLSVAGGQVTCGECDAVFDALTSLVEERDGAPQRAPVAAPDAAPAYGSTASGSATLALFGAPGEPAIGDLAVPSPAAEPANVPLNESPAARVEPASETEPDREPSASATPDSDALPEIDIALDAEYENRLRALDVDHGTDPEALPDLAPDLSLTRSDDLLAVDFEVPAAHAPRSLSADEHAILFTEPGSDDRLGDTIPEARAMVEALYGELGPPPPAPRSSLWPALAVLLAVALLAQLAWFGRLQVERWLPDSAGVYDKLCLRLGCAESPVTSAIRLVARDVREHPQYRDALLVNATLVNESTEPQPFPVIDLRLHDAAGRVLGRRKFAPADYLDQSIELGDGMPPGRPVYIVLELGGDAATAASFEFTFM